MTAASVAILTAGMGAGHDRVADELSRRLRARGVEAETVDIWQLLPLRLGHLITGFYKAVIRDFPWVYEGIYSIWLRPRGASARRASPIIRLAGRRLERWMAVRRPAAIVSTFHVCSQVLGDMRRRGLMAVPTASVVVDFAAHGMWVDPDVDVHFCLHAEQAERVRSMGARRVVACGPVVGQPFSRYATGRDGVRRRLGLRPEETAVLIVAGSWGAGPVIRATRTVASSGRFHPVVATGRNEPLRRRLARIPGATVLGWVDDMAGLMAAADVVVENAGGLMAMEAMATGTPVISFAPIPGHGRENVSRMDEAGISLYARSDGELLQLLDRLSADRPFRRRLTRAAADMFRSDLAHHVAGLLSREPGGDFEGYVLA